jgi:mono/diheme cytochrome c family protein
VKKQFKILGFTSALLAVLAGTGFATASVKARARLSRTFDSHKLETLVTSEAPEDAVARGKHLVDARYACNVCHGANFAGGSMIEDPAIGSIPGPNITAGRGGRVANYQTADWDRIVRHGIKPDGTPALMPSEDFFRMSDQELSDIIAYIKSQPPVDAEVPEPSLGALGIVLVATGKLPVSAEALPDHMRAHASVPPAAGDTPAFGEHLAAICSSCHRANFAGGPMPFGPPSWPPASNLTPHATGLAGWSYEDFDKAITTGVTKSGKTLREPMIVILPAAKAMQDVERRALWTYLQSLPPRALND